MIHPNVFEPTNDYGNHLNWKVSDDLCVRRRILWGQHPYGSFPVWLDSAASKMPAGGAVFPYVQCRYGAFATEWPFLLQFSSYRKKLLLSCCWCQQRTESTATAPSVSPATSCSASSTAAWRSNWATRKSRWPAATTEPSCTTSWDENGTAVPLRSHCRSLKVSRTLCIFI